MQQRMQWAGQMYTFLEVYRYGSATAVPRRIRVLASGGGGATALANSFMLSTAGVGAAANRRAER
jgi:hypothetical protein